MRNGPAQFAGPALPESILEAARDYLVACRLGLLPIKPRCNALYCTTYVV